MLRKLFILVLVIIAVLLFFGFMKKIRREQVPSLPLGAGDYDFSLVHNELTRYYKVHVPLGYNEAKPTPLILAFHGGGGNAENGPKYFGLNQKSDKEGFLLVYPEGSGKKVLGKTFASWNAGRCCGPALKNNIDDVGFINALIEKIKADFNVDGKRIFVTGMSNGAQMAYRLACELSDKIAAIAPSGSQGTFDNCQPERPVPVLHIQGKLDPCSLYGGGTCGRCMADFWNEIGVPAQYDDWACVSILSYIDTWRIRNGCSEKTSITFQNKGATCIAYEGCRQHADVVLCTVEGLGHNWSGQETYGVEACDTNPDGKICQTWKDKVGPLNQDLIANNQIWEFFKKHPME